jgi:acyl carrier protein
MTQATDIRSGVRSFILDNFLVGEPPESLENSTLLMTTGIVSSLAMLELVAFLEETYAVTLRQDDLTPDRLDSVDLIVELVDELRGLGKEVS